MHYIKKCIPELNSLNINIISIHHIKLLKNLYINITNNVAGDHVREREREGESNIKKRLYDVII